MLYSRCKRVGRSRMYGWTQMVLHEWVELLMQGPHPTGAMIVFRRCFRCGDFQSGLPRGTTMSSSWGPNCAIRGDIIELDHAFSPRKIFERVCYLESSCQIIDKYPILMADSATILSFLWPLKFSFFFVFFVRALVCGMYGFSFLCTVWHASTKLRSHVSHLLPS